MAEADHDLEREFQELLERNKHNLPFLQKVEANDNDDDDDYLRPRRVFDDAFVEKERRKFNFSSHLYTRSEVKNVLIRFYNFYFTGDIETEDTVVTTVLDMVALTKTPNGFMWLSKEPLQKGFYPANKSTLLSMKEIHVPNSSLTDFYRSVKRIIESINVSKQASYYENILLKLSGFLALTLLRFVNKSFEHMKSLFQGDHYKNNLKTILQLSDAPFSPPSRKCLVLCSQTINNEKDVMSKVFLILVDEYRRSCSTKFADNQVAKYLLTSVLSDTANHGMGLLHLIDKVCKITKKKWYEIMEETYHQNTANSWKEIEEFFESQLTEGDEQMCYPWARLINNALFTGLCPERHCFLATVFARVIEKEEGPGIWNADWAKNQMIPQSAVEQGDALHRKYCTDGTDYRFLGRRGTRRSRKSSSKW